MGFIYQEANAYGVEALVALERHYTPTEEKYCTAVTEAVRICDTYGWELEIMSLDWAGLIPALQAGTIDAVIAGQSMTETRLQEVDMAGPYFYASIVCVTRQRTRRRCNSCSLLSPAATPVWHGFWSGIMFAPAAKKLINIQATHPSSGCGTSSPPWASIRRTPSPRRSSWTPSATSSTTWTSPACPLPTGGGC